MIRGIGDESEIAVEHMQQPSATSCVHTCLSMVTGIPVEQYITRFGDDGQGLGNKEETVALVEAKVFPIAVPHVAPHPFPMPGVYLVSVPSLNIPGKLHRVVVEADADGYTVFDPNEGKEGKKAHPRDGMASGDVPYADVTFLCMSTLRKMRNTVAEAGKGGAS